jgi:cytoskeletal protein CcmA (bactofilin family)
MFSRGKNRANQGSDPMNWSKPAGPQPSSETPVGVHDQDSAAPASEQPLPNTSGLSQLKPKSDEKKLVIGRRITLRGEISSCDYLIVQGRAELDIESCRKIEVLESGSLKGSATADQASIAGHYEGSLTIRETLSVGRVAQIKGSIRYGRLKVEVGAEITGEIRSLGRKGDSRDETSHLGRQVASNGGATDLSSGPANMANIY